MVLRIQELPALPLPVIPRILRWTVLPWINRIQWMGRRMGETR
jgi:hypothetical protein